MHKEVAEAISRKFFDAIKANPGEFGEHFYDLMRHKNDVVPGYLVEQAIEYAVENFESTAKEIQDSKKQEEIRRAVEVLTNLAYQFNFSSGLVGQIEDLIDELKELIK